MLYILFALLLFVGSVSVHIFYCRRSLQRGLHIKAYGFIAFIFFCIYTLGALGIHHWFLFKTGSLWSMPFKVTAGIVFILLVPFYLTFYRHTQLMSPSQKILLTMAQRGAVSFSDIVASIHEENFIGTRLADLCVSQCVRHEQGRYALGPSGKRIAMVLKMMQDILGRDMGG